MSRSLAFDAGPTAAGTPQAGYGGPRDRRGADALPAFRPRAVVGRVAGLVRRARARPALAPAGRQRRGPCWSASSCCSRRRWSGSAGRGGAGWSAGPLRRPWPRPPPARPSGPGAGSATRAGRCGCTRRRWPSPSASAARCRPTWPTLLSLPGVGSYTAAAIASFAYGRRHVVLDTNVRRVLGPGGAGTAQPAGCADVGSRLAVADRAPARATRAGRPAGRWPRWSSARWSAPPARRGAPSARSRDLCAWRRAGVRRSPVPRGGARRTRAPTGSAAAPCWPCCASSDGPVTADELDAAWAGRGPARTSADLTGRRRTGGRRRRPLGPARADLA